MNKNVTRQSGQCLSGLDSGAFFKRRGAARATPLGSVGLPVGVRTSIYRVRRNRRVGLRRHRPWGCESDAGKGHPQREYTDNVLNFQRKLHDLFHSHSPKTFVFRRNVLKIMSITFLLFPNYIALVPKRGEKEGRKKRKTGKKSTKTPLFCRFLPRFLSRVSVFLFSPALSVCFLRGRKPRCANFQVSQGTFSPFFVYLHDHIAPRRPV